MNELARVVHQLAANAERNSLATPAGLTESEVTALQDSQHWLSIPDHELAARLIEFAEPGEWWAPVPAVITAAS